MLCIINWHVVCTLPCAPKCRMFPAHCYPYPWSTALVSAWPSLGEARRLVKEVCCSAATASRWQWWLGRRASSKKGSKTINIGVGPKLHWLFSHSKTINMFFWGEPSIWLPDDKTVRWGKKHQIHYHEPGFFQADELWLRGMEPKGIQPSNLPSGKLT